MEIGKYMKFNYMGTCRVKGSSKTGKHERRISEGYSKGWGMTTDVNFGGIPCLGALDWGHEPLGSKSQ